MAEKHTREELKQWQSLPLDVKIMMTKDRIRAWYEHWEGKVYVSFSGGKDSTVLKHIVDSMYENVPSLFINTGLEYPEIQKFAMSQLKVETIRPKLNFKEVIERYGYPVISKEVSKDVFYARKNGEKDIHWKKLHGAYGNKRYTAKKWEYLEDAPFKISERCCYYMKKSSAKGWEKKTQRKPMIAVMADEGLQRETQWLRFGCNIFDSDRPVSKPMSFWTEQDVLRYLVEYNVPYCEVYGDIKVKLKNQVGGQMSIYDLTNLSTEGEVLETTGAKRTGCIFCMFGCHLEKEPNRFQRLKETHPRQYEYCIQGGQWVDGQWMPSDEGLGLWRVLDTIGVKY